MRHYQKKYFIESLIDKIFDSFIKCFKLLNETFYVIILIDYISYISNILTIFFTSSMTLSTNLSCMLDSTNILPADIQFSPLLKNTPPILY